MKLIAVVAGVVGVCGANANAGIYEQLSAAQQAQVQRGEQVVVTTDVAGSPWPQVTIYERVESTPEEAAAVFNDYELQTEYVSNMDKVTVVSRPNKSTAIVDYSMSVFFFSIDYRLQNSLTVYDQGNSYRFDWKFLQGNRMNDIRGLLKIEKLGTASVVMYQNLIVPQTSSFKDKAIDMTVEAAAGIRDQIQKERTENPALLQTQIQNIRSALYELFRRSRKYFEFFY